MTVPRGEHLPLLPPLLPLEIQMPDPSHSTSLSIPSHRDSSSYLHSPIASSLASQDSFSTALSSSSPMDPDGPTPDHLLPSSSSLAPPTSLRKSISVDSFVNYGREAPSSSTTTRPNRVHTESAMHPPKSLIFSTGLKPEREQHAPSGRTRGSSISAVADEYDPALSDAERYGPLNTVAEGVRRTSLKDQRRPLIRGGELPLPSRSQTISTTSSISSMSITHEDSPNVNTHISSYSQPRRGPTLSLDAIPPNGRIRSGSLGGIQSNPRHILINTQVPTHSIFSKHSPVTLTVVGTTGCGKSAVIRRGLKGHSLSEPSTVFSPSNTQGVASSACMWSSNSIRFLVHAGTNLDSERIGKMDRYEDVPDCPLHVLEIEVPAVVDPLSSNWSLCPEGAPRLDGVIICYDASDEASFRPVEGLLRGYRAMKLPTLVLACKSDLNKQIEPLKAVAVLQRYDVGLVEVSSDEIGKGKIRRSVSWLLKAIFRQRRHNELGDDDNYRNPASPALTHSPPPWEQSRTSTPTAASSAASATTISPAPITMSRFSQVPTSSPLAVSPTRAHSTGDLLSEHEKSKSNGERQLTNATQSSLNLGHSDSDDTTSPLPPPDDDHNDGDDAPEHVPEHKKEEPRLTQKWATLEELLDKLLFLAVSGDDPAYIIHFLLTYRRFASPRSVLLAMQKRMRQLDNPSGDPMFACFAQMRICHLLELWIRDYPYDFRVQGASDALAALIRSIISKTYLLHYGSDFLPFLEMIPSLVDKDAAWALKVDHPADESDDSYSLLDDEEDRDPISEVDSLTDSTHSPISLQEKSNPPSLKSNGRKSSQTLSTRVLSAPGPISLLSSGQTDQSNGSSKAFLSDLVKIAREVNNLDVEEIAQEVTRVEAKLFLDIEPRQWLQYTFGSSAKRDPRTDRIIRFNVASNHLADWVASLILCHDKPKARAKQMEKFVEVAQRLRALNNYSALRAFVAGITLSTFEGDQSGDLFKFRSPDHAKNLQSWDVLLQQRGAHRAYRLALRNSKGACIPALEIHGSDLIRADEGNPDAHAEDPTKIHWAKFNMLGKFITITTQCQIQCRTSKDYDFPERLNISNLIWERNVMNDQMQKTRMTPLDDEYDVQRPPHREGINLINAPNQAIIRKLFFW